jgi:hypothetical protein
MWNSQSRDEEKTRKLAFCFHEIFSPSNIVDDIKHLLSFSYYFVIFLLLWFVLWVPKSFLLIITILQDSIFTHHPMLSKDIYSFSCQSQSLHSSFIHQRVNLSYPPLYSLSSIYNQILDLLNMKVISSHYLKILSQIPPWFWLIIRKVS